MIRFAGMMPNKEIEREEVFKDRINLNVVIQAGPNGWTILFADGSSEYKDVEAATDENFEEAKHIAESKIGKLTSLKELKKVCTNLRIHQIKLK